MSAPFNRLPECLASIVEAFSRAHGHGKADAMLSKGVNLDEAFITLRDAGGHSHDVACQLLYCAWQFGVIRFDAHESVLVLRITPRGTYWDAETKSWAWDGVQCVTNGESIPGHRGTLTIPRASLPETAVGSAAPAHLSALIAWLGAKPGAKKAEAEAEALRLDPSLSDNEKALDGILYLARHGAGLDQNFPPGAPRKNP